jgi:hypothetical protein
MESACSRVQGRTGNFEIEHLLPGLRHHQQEVVEPRLDAGDLEALEVVP